jgi:hypothetical protein
MSRSPAGEHGLEPSQQHNPEHGVTDSRSHHPSRRVTRSQTGVIGTYAS